MYFDYYESAEDLPITWRRAILELKRHCIECQEDIWEFKRDCWDRFSKDGEIQAQRVLAWLGY